MFRFQHPTALYLLALPLLLLLLFAAWQAWRKKKRVLLGDAPLVAQQLALAKNSSIALRFTLLTAALICIVVALANPQLQGAAASSTRKGVEVILALDVSKSMLATDVPPNRLTRARQLCERLIARLGNDRIGLNVFAGRAYPQVPLTTDHPALLMGLAGAAPDAVPAQGTVLGDAIILARQSFTAKERKFKTLLIISDGEDHDEAAEGNAKTAFNDDGIIIHTIGVGSPQGAVLTDPATGAPRKDDAGNPVISKLNEPELKNIAAAGHGTYHLLGNTESLAAGLSGEIGGMEQKGMGATSFRDYRSYFQPFLAAAVLLILVSTASSTQPKTQKKKTITDMKTAIVLFFLMFFSLPAFTQQQVRAGNKLYAAGNYADAVAAYRKALQKNPSLLSGNFNLGNALLRQGQADAARTAYVNALKAAPGKASGANAQYNTGNTWMQQQKYQEAVTAYRDALRNNPGDADAKYNLSYALQKLKQQQQQDQKKDQQKDPKKKDDQQQNKDQQNMTDPGNKPKPEDGPKPQEQQPKPTPGKLSTQQADNILNALQQQERRTKGRLQKGNGVPQNMDKDW